MPTKPMPDKATLNRMYWLDELSTREIAAAIGSNKMRVMRYLHKYGIPMRKASGFHGNRPALCIVKGCGKEVAKVKRKNAKGLTYWSYTNRCPEHRHEMRRQSVYNWFKRTKGWTRSKPGSSRRKPPGTIAEIAQAKDYPLLHSGELGYYGRTRGVWKKRKSGDGSYVMQLIQGKVPGPKKKVKSDQTP